MKRIKTTWGKVFENDGLVLFNNYPEIVTKTGDVEELYHWDTYDEETDSYEEIYQWYIIPHDYTVEWLNKFCPEIDKDIRYSDTIGHYILAVRHWGTGWDAVPTELEVDDSDEDGEQLARFYQKTYHDDLPEWVKRNVFNEQ